MDVAMWEKILAKSWEKGTLRPLHVAAMLHLAHLQIFKTPRNPPNRGKSEILATC